MQFVHRLAVTHGANRIRATVGDEVRLAVICLSLFCNLRQLLVAPLFWHKDDLCAAEQIQKQVSLRLFRLFACQHQDATHPKPGCCCSHLPAVVGLNSTGADEGLAASCHGVRCKVFQFAGLISAKTEPGQVVAFDKMLWTAQNL